MKAILSIFLLCLTLFPAAAWSASEEVQAQGFMPPGERGEQARAREPRISPNEASSIARENMPGSRVLNIRRDEQNNYRVRIDQGGNVSDVLVNSESGRVSRSDAE